ncbi:hypothetical protein AGLY_001401, partial [Aphis glycines]
DCTREATLNESKPKYVLKAAQNIMRCICNVQTGVGILSILSRYIKYNSLPDSVYSYDHSGHDVNYNYCNNAVQCTRFARNTTFVCVLLLHVTIIILLLMALIEKQRTVTIIIKIYNNIRITIRKIQSAAGRRPHCAYFGYGIFIDKNTIDIYNRQYLISEPWNGIFTPSVTYYNAQLISLTNSVITNVKSYILYFSFKSENCLRSKYYYVDRYHL